jgi:hypothetical protein
MAPRTSMALAAAALAGAGCGGGDGGGGETPAEVRSCLAGKRYVASAKPGSAVLGTTGQVEVELPGSRAVVYFFSSEEIAQRQALELGTVLSRTGGGGHTIRTGKVVVGYARKPRQADREALDACVGS